MKKAAILSITTFYLLLTTGMFVCIVHCAAETLAAKPVMHMTGAVEHNCKKDCDCCKKHGNYVIKENIKPATDIQYTQTAILIRHFENAGFLLNTIAFQNTSWEESNAPPGRSGKAISIQNCSLLI